MVLKSVNESNELLSPSFNQDDSSKQKNLGKQDFLRFMVAQIQKNNAIRLQMDNDFLSQLDEFSERSGTTKMHESTQQMATSLQSNQALQASAFVGRKVLVNSDSFKLGLKDNVTIAMEVFPGLDHLSISIYTESAELIKTILLGQPAPGLFQFNWDGIGESGQRVEEGHYNVIVHAVSKEKKLHLKTMVYANVDSVSLDPHGEGLKLNVAGVGAIALEQVRQISV